MSISQVCKYFAIGILAIHGIAAISDPMTPVWIAAIGYIPTIFLTVITLTIAAVSFRLRQPRGGLQILLAACVHFLALGDYSFWSGIGRASAMGPTAEAGTSEEQHLSVMAINAEFLRSGADAIANFVHQHKPAVVLFSEFEYAPQQLEAIRRSFLPYQIITSSARDTAVATLLPVLDANEVPLPTHQPSLQKRNRIEDQRERPQRSFLHVQLMHAGRSVNILPIRFIAGRPESYGIIGQLKWGRYLLEAQRREVQVFTDYVQSLDGPSIFGGDLNATHTSQIVTWLSGIGSDVDLRTNFFAHNTFKTTPLPFLPGRFPAMRLDYVFATSDFLPLSARTIPWELSDHNPVLAKVRLRKSDPSTDASMLSAVRD